MKASNRLPERIGILLEKIRANQNPRFVCLAELGYLKRTRTLTTVRREISRYRSAIAGALGKNHPSLAFLRLRDADQLLVAREYGKTLATRHRARRPLIPSRHLATAREVLQRMSTAPPLELAAAIIAVTGRRPLEVLADIEPGTADFRRVKAGHGPGLIFSGQRKTRGAASAVQGPYFIPCLVDPDLAFIALITLRERYDLRGLSPEAIGARCWNLLGQYAKGLRPKQLSHGYRDAKGKPLTPKDLRAAYATIAYERFAPEKQTFNSYAASVLGHSEDDINTSLSYDVFYLKGDK
jgi:hypothetical protein